MRPFGPRLLAGLLGAALCLGSAAAQGGGTRETEWPPPTAADWARPCLVTFQRSFEDAQAVSRETGKPLLICVNMDGEIASEHYAGKVYRDPETAALYEPYVCVIASVYRHTPRDHDEQGRRILCPRFGSVTCGEHIAIEPGLYRQYFDGTRVAPRHIDVDERGGERFDVYYAFTVGAVLDAIRTGGARSPGRPSDARGDRSLAQLVASRDVADRQTVEQAWMTSEPAVRRELLAAAAALGPDVPLELLRLAVLDADPELARAARLALAQTDSEQAVELVNRVLGQVQDEGERQALIATLERLAPRSSRARALAVVHRGLGERSASLDVRAWRGALDRSAPPRAGAPGVVPALDAEARAASLARQDETLAAQDGAGRLQLAEALLDLADDEPDAELRRWVLIDARESARAAQGLGADPARAARVLTLCAWRLGEDDEALAFAPAAAAAIPAEAGGPDDALVLSLFARQRREAIAAAIRESREWPARWLADVQACWQVLAVHPHADELQAAAHHDFVAWFGAEAQAAQVLDAGLARFPTSAPLHERLQTRLLRASGPWGLRAAYDRLLAEAAAEHRAQLALFAAEAARLAAEQHRRERSATEAREAYDAVLRHVEAALATDPGLRGSTDALGALALVGRARVFAETGDALRALADLLMVFALRPDVADDLDGLNLSALDTARLLRARFVEDGRQGALQQLDAALRALDPELHRPPAYETNDVSPERGRSPGAEDAPGVPES